LSAPRRVLSRVRTMGEGLSCMCAGVNGGSGNAVCLLYVSVQGMGVDLQGSCLSCFSCCLHSIHGDTLIHQLLELFQRIRFGEWCKDHEFEFGLSRHLQGGMLEHQAPHQRMLYLL
jgi:hypothetical protein